MMFRAPKVVAKLHAIIYFMLGRGALCAGAEIMFVDWVNWARHLTPSSNPSTLILLTFRELRGQ